MTGGQGRSLQSYVPQAHRIVPQPNGPSGSCSAAANGAGAKGRGATHNLSACFSLDLKIFIALGVEPSGL